MAWDRLRETEPALFDHAVRLLSEHHGFAFLATSAGDGSPRLHPVAPIVTATEIYLAVSVGSPKLRDLTGDARFSLHSSVHPPDDEELSVRGRAAELPDEHRRRTVDRERLCGAELHPTMTLLDLSPDHVAWTTWRDGSPSRVTWRSARRH